MAMYRVNNFLVISRDINGQMDMDAVLKNGVASIIDLRTQLPKDYVTRERMLINKTGIMYALMPADPKQVMPFQMNEMLARYILGDMSNGMRVTVHENEGQGVASLMAATALMRMGMSPKDCVHQVSQADHMNLPDQDPCGDDMTPNEHMRNFMNTLGEFYLKKPYIRDYNEEMMYMKKIMDATQAPMPPEEKTTPDKVMASFLGDPSWGRLVGRQKGGCGGCGEK